MTAGCAEGYAPEPGEALEALTGGAAGMVAMDDPEPMMQTPAPSTPEPTMPTPGVMTPPEEPSDAMDDAMDDAGDAAMDSGAMASGGSMDCNTNATVCTMALACCKPDGTCGIGAAGLLCL